MNGSTGFKRFTSPGNGIGPGGLICADFAVHAISHVGLTAAQRAC
jgi:hypothetical protein